MLAVAAALRRGAGCCRSKGKKIDQDTACKSKSKTWCGRAIKAEAVAKSYAARFRKTCKQVVDRAGAAADN